MKDDVFPIASLEGARTVGTRTLLLNEGEFFQVVCVPMAMVEKHKDQILKNHHGKTLDKLKQLGGITANEMVAVLEDRYSSFFSEAKAHARLRRHVEVFLSKQGLTTPRTV